MHERYTACNLAIKPLVWSSDLPQEDRIFIQDGDTPPHCRVAAPMLDEPLACRLIMSITRA